MAYQLIEDIVNIYNFPKRTKPPCNVQLAIGDLHGNAIKLLFILIKEGVALNVDEKAYEQLVEIYRCGLKFLTPDYLREFNAIVAAIQFNNKVKITLIGDELADRGVNDYFTLKILQRLIEQDVPIESIISNHAVEVVLASERPNITTLTATILGKKLTNSLTGLNFLLEKGWVVIEEVLSVIQYVYKPTLKALSYSFSGDPEKEDAKIIIYSHAAIDLEIIRLLSVQFKVDYQDATVRQLAQTIDNINSEFQKQVQANTLHSQCPLDLMNKAYSSKYDLREGPLVFVMWNRRYDFLKRENKNNNYEMVFVHGHDSNTIGQSHIFNLETALGKDVSPWYSEGEYKILKSDTNAPLSPINNYLESYLESAYCFNRALASCPDKQNREMIYEIMQDKLPGFIKSSYHFNLILEFLPEEIRGAIYQQIHHQLPALIKKNIDLCRVLEFLSPDKRQEIFRSVSLLDFIENVYDFRNVVEFIPLEQWNKNGQTIIERAFNVCNSVRDVVLIIKSLTAQQLKMYCDNNDLVSFVDSIKSHSRLSECFKEILKNFQENSYRAIIHDVIKEKLSTIISNDTYNFIILEYLSISQRAEIYEMVKDKLPNMINDGYHFLSAIQYLSVEQRTTVYNTVKHKLSSTIRQGNSLNRFNYVLKYLSIKQRAEFYQMVRDNLLAAIQAYPLHSLHFHNVLEYLSTKDRLDFYQKIQNKLPSMVNSLSNIPNIMKYLPDRERRNFFQAITCKLPNLVKCHLAANSGNIDVNTVVDILVDLDSSENALLMENFDQMQRQLIRQAFIKALEIMVAKHTLEMAKKEMAKLDIKIAEKEKAEKDKTKELKKANVIEIAKNETQESEASTNSQNDTKEKSLSSQAVSVFQDKMNSLCGEKDKIKFLKELKEVARSLSKNEILDLFGKMKDPDDKEFKFIHVQKNPVWDSFRLFFKSFKNQGEKYWHTKTYQSAVKILKQAYLNCGKPNDADEREKIFIDYVRGNSPVHSKHTSTYKHNKLSQKRHKLT